MNYIHVRMDDGRAFAKEWPGRDTEEAEQGVRYMFSQGNYSCDCNRGLFLGEEEDRPCGEILRIKTLDFIYNDMTYYRMFDGEPRELWP